MQMWSSFVLMQIATKYPKCRIPLLEIFHIFVQYLYSQISFCSVKAADQRIAHITSELSTQKVIQKHCDSYRLCRKVIEDCKSAKNPKEYRSKHLAEYQLHDSLKKELQDLGITKIPSSNKIQKQIENLESEQAATVREKQKLQKKQKTLDIIQQNFSVLLDAPEINSDLLPAKREPVSVTRDK
jgi:arsenate reductase-like glutaredoxin family protein